jgi:hypothetical protein
VTGFTTITHRKITKDGFSYKKKTLTVKRLVNNSVAQSPSREDDSRTAGQENPHLLNKLKIHCLLEKRSRPEPSEFSSLLHTPFNLSSNRCKGLSPLQISHVKSCTHLSRAYYTPRPSHSLAPRIITSIMFLDIIHRLVHFLKNTSF